jgi:hypothetical protein
MQIAAKWKSMLYLTVCLFESELQFFASSVKANGLFLLPDHL